MGILYNHKPSHEGDRTGHRGGLGGCNKAPKEMERQAKSPQGRQATNSHNRPPGRGQKNPGSTDEKTSWSWANNPEKVKNHIVLYCPELREQRAYLLAETGTTDIRRVVNNKKTAGKAAQWLLRTNVLAQFKVALEIEEEEMEGWKPFQPLEEMC
ncbi:hypothetical protein K402DRAFT_416463 [Aulographum hederae CBS 113979]|uniref:Uncharacterized protein n=1 Tax=Aulographum hederae CBS 113979 TaxID=1176131 RepID=A0A6G1HFF5_9PEZI|nr:hypothetical protein K402DRAFT_416463 [Aulographum hederae CBS 113979]